jgi:HSP20 family protein
VAGGPALPDLYDWGEAVSELLRRDAAELAEDARQLLLELDRAVPGADAAAAECRPPIDILEAAQSVEVVVDVPGIPAESLRVAIRRDTVLVVGVKLPRPVDPAARFHLAERSHGRFARAVRLAAAVDASRARAVVSSGQLRIILPRIEDRRGRLLAVPVERG